MFAMFLAVHSVDVMCAGKYYQPKVLKELDQFRNRFIYDRKLIGALSVIIKNLLIE
jgi:hypothetical protein